MNINNPIKESLMNIYYNIVYFLSNQPNVLNESLVPFCINHLNRIKIYTITSHTAYSQNLFFGFFDQFVDPVKIFLYNGASIQNSEIIRAEEGPIVQINGRSSDSINTKSNESHITVTSTTSPKLSISGIKNT